jgi:hypothetical protein
MTAYKNILMGLYLKYFKEMKSTFFHFAGVLGFWGFGVLGL